MSADAGIDLIKAVRAALVADAYLTTQVGARIFSTWDNAPDLPFIRLWVGTAEGFEMDGGGDGSETALSAHVFAGTVVLARQIASKVRDVLKDSDPTLDGSNSVAFQFKNIIAVRDADDPSLQMAVARFTALTTTK